MDVVISLQLRGLVGAALGSQHLLPTSETSGPMISSSISIMGLAASPAFGGFQSRAESSKCWFSPITEATLSWCQPRGRIIDGKNIVGAVAVGAFRGRRIASFTEFAVHAHCVGCREIRMTIAA